MNNAALPIRPGARLFAYLQLTRPANVITAWADILAGYGAGYGAAGLVTAADSSQVVSLLWLLLATSGLYAGGVTFNDVFDAELDAVERPERPIPSGRASYIGAGLLGAALLTVGVVAAMQVSLLSGGIALVIALLALTYDKFSKHSALLGPVNMGLCRGGNLLLGVSAAGTIAPVWFLLFIPLIYIGAVTTMSRQEVFGGDRQTGVIAVSLLGLTLAALVGLIGLPAVHWPLLPFVALLALLTLSPFLRATRMPDALTVRAAVKAGVLALIVMDGAIAAGFAGGVYGLCVLALLPLSAGVARLFAVT